jgi:type IV secretory pathway VirB3-like protein
LIEQFPVHGQTPSVKKEYIYAGGKLIATEEPFNCSGGAPIAPLPSLPLDTVWVEDQVPAGAAQTGTWTWDTTQKASGIQSNTEPAGVGLHQHYFTGASQTLSIASGDTLVTYILINPCNPPQEIMLQWYDSSGSWEHRAYWGTDLISYGTSGTSSRYPMGALPPSGAWVRLEVPATNVGLGGQVITGMAFTLYGGQAWFDRAGKGGCQVSVAPPPSPVPPDTDTVWVEDQVPAGAILQGTWNWDTTQKASGTQSNTEPASAALHQHYFYGGQTLYIASGEKLVCYVLINPCAPPQEIMLQWQDSTGSWDHRAFWGADLIAEGTSGTASRYPMGALPQSGAWVRLEVPATNIGLGDKVISGMSFSLYGGQAWFDRAGKGGCQISVASPPSSLPPDTVWVEDQVPAGATLQGTWTWDTNQKASGTQSSTDPSTEGLHQHWFSGTSETLYIGSAEKLVCYILINPCDPPQEIMLQWQDSTGSWDHRAFWGADLISAGTSGTSSRYPMGGLPQSGAWVRMEIPAADVGLGSKIIKGMGFTLYGGQAWFDRAGKTVCQFPVALTPGAINPPDTVWVEDQVPAGATLQGTWNWDTTQKASGTQSNTDPAAPGMHEHYFIGATQTLSVATGEKVVGYVLINPCDPPQEIMLQWQDSTGSWDHRAFWGADLIALGTSGTPSRYYMGPLPSYGNWIRLEVPASAVGLEGKTLTGMSFTVYDGKAWFDKAGKWTPP